MHPLLSLAISDFKLIFRDQSLRIFLFMPALIFGMVLFVIPDITERFMFISEYIPLVLMGATMQTSTMFGFIYGMVFIHEKDIHVAQVYGVLPISKKKFVTARLVIPAVLSTIVTLILLIVQPFYAFANLDMIFLAILCGILGPILTLTVSILSNNKMEGMTWFKFVNLLVSIPMAAFFVSKYAICFGVIPTYWPFQVLNQMVLGEGMVVTLLIGFVFQIALLYFLVKRFSRVHFL